MKHFLILIALIITCSASAQEYKKQWQKATSFEAQGEFKKAAAAVDAIYTRAKKDHNEPQLLRAFFFKSKYLQMHDEDARQRIIDNLAAEIKTATPATKALMESLYARMLYDIYQQGRYSYNNREDIEGITPQKIAEWSQEDFQQAIAEAFERSIANRDVLYKTQLSNYDAIINFAPVLAKTNRSLYDFLVEAYLDNLAVNSAYGDINIPQKEMAHFFGDEHAFQQATLPDSIAAQLPGLALTKQVEAFYMQKQDTLAMQQSVLRRLNHFDATSYHSSRQPEYLATLHALAARWGQSPFAYRARVKEAGLYLKMADKIEHPDYNNKALELCNYMLANNSLHDVGYEAQNIKAGVLSVSATIKTERYIAPNKPSLAAITFKNLDSVQVTLYRVPQPMAKNNARYSYNLSYTPAQADSLAKQKPFLQKIYLLPHKQDYFTYSTEVILPPVPQGYYLVKISPVKDSVAANEYGITEFQAVHISLLEQQADGTTNYYVTNRDTGAPVPGVVVTASGTAGQFKTDAKGSVSINNAGKNGEYINTRFIYAGDTLTSGFYNYAPRYNEYGPRISAKIYFDRAIYRPGQKVFFKGIVTQSYKGVFSVVPNRYFIVTAEDPSNNEIKTFSLKTNEFGSFTGEFDLPKGGMTGRYSLSVEEDDDNTSDPDYNPATKNHAFWDDAYFNSNEFSFSVEEYKRPTFEVTFAPVTQTVALNKSITVSGLAKSFSGSSLGGAQVNYRVRREKDYQYSYYRNDDYYYGDDDNEGGYLIKADSVTTDAQGNFKITFLAKSESEPGKDNEAIASKDVYNYTVYADITDSNGETHTAEVVVKAGYRSLYASVSTEGVIDAKKGGAIKFSTTNLNGQPTPATARIDIYKIVAPTRILTDRPWEAPEIQLIPEAEFIKNFPHLPYGNETDTLTEPKPYLTKNINTGKEKSLNLSGLKNWPSGKYSVVFTVTDSLGRQEKQKSAFTLLRSNDNLLPDNEIFIFKQINRDPVKDGYVAVEVRTALPLIYGNLSAYANRTEVYNEPVVVQNGRAIIKVPVVKNPETVMALEFSFVWQNRLFSNTLHAYTYTPPEPLTIDMESTHNKLAPGGEQTWSFTIKNGKNTEAELLASMYDASLDQFAKTGWSSPDTYTYEHDNVPYKQLKNTGQGNTAFTIYMQNKIKGIRWGDSFYTYGFDIIKSHNTYSFYPPKQQIAAPGDIIVSGTVKDDIGYPLPGVTVKIAGTEEATETDFDGKYIIYVAKSEQIEFSYIIYKKLIKNIPENHILDIVIAEQDYDGIDEVVVEGYRSTSRKTSNVAVTTITAETIEGRPNASFVESLQGQIPGLNVSTASGSPGSGTTVILRGAASSNGYIQPLYVIDGVPMGPEEFRSLSEDDIVNISVLKDAAATSIYGNRGANGVVVITTKKTLDDLKQVQARKNFNETAFFFPQLRTDKKGDISFTFTSPEALTEWKLRLLAHNKKGVSGYLEKKFFTQKDLMVVPNMPRFLRETDTITLSAKITNMTPDAKNGNAMLQLFDAVTQQPVDVQMGNAISMKPFTLSPTGSTTVTWKISVPVGLQGVQYKILAKAGNFTDGEENILHVLTNSMLVTESLPLWVREKSTKTYTFNNFKGNTSTTLRHHGITLEYTSNPAWLALKSLPYLMEFEHECAEQVFSRYYANSIASHIINSNPKIAEVFTAWRKEGITPRLEQNEELKSVILAETPWMLDNQSEEEQKNRLALLFDLSTMKNSLDANFRKLQEKQLPSGAFPWFAGGTEDEYITRHIVAGFGHLSKLGILSKKDSISVSGITKKAVPYLDKCFLKRDKEAKKLRGKKDNFRMPYPYADLHYLYTRSFYIKQFPMGDSLKAAIKPYIGDIKLKWRDYTVYEKGMAALVLNRFGETETAKKVLTYLKESSATNEEAGMYWIDNKPGWWWYQAPVETQALLIEAFAEVDNDAKSVDAMKVWLIKQKQNKNWPTTKATTEAVYALLMQGTDWLSVKDKTAFTLGDKAVFNKKLAEADKEAGTGYLKLQWNAGEITNNMATLTVENKSDVPGYGGFYWQYFENLDKVRPAQEGIMNIKKELYLKNSAAKEVTLVPVTEKSPLKVGDRVTIRLVLTIKKDMEYVHLKDMRAAAFEPVDVLSGYHYKDGLGYYQSTRDAATHFFFNRIARGTYVLEYDVRVNNAGEFSNGITTLQSMYAPEFSGHSAGVRVKIE